MRRPAMQATLSLIEPAIMLVHGAHSSPSFWSRLYLPIILAGRQHCNRGNGDGHRHARASESGTRKRRTTRGDARRRYRCEFIDLEARARSTTSCSSRIPVDLMFRYNFVPLRRRTAGRCEIVVADPTPPEPDRRAVELLLGTPLEVDGRRRSSQIADDAQEDRAARSACWRRPPRASSSSSSRRTKRRRRDARRSTG
ncbi:MAG: hypothetical protein MZV70_19345 [Desulfobacterales bacterium]|nr:hypothetical protein [Desulfobacterales bacterium]